MSRTVSGLRPASTMALYSSEGDSSVLTMSNFPDSAEEQAGQMAGERLNSPEPCWSQKTCEQAVTQAKPLNLVRHLVKLHRSVSSQRDMDMTAKSTVKQSNVCGVARFFFCLEGLKALYGENYIVILTITQINNEYLLTLDIKRMG